MLAYPEFRHSNKTKEIVKEEGAQLQVTKLARPIEARTEYMNIQRIHVANFTSPQKLLKEIEKLTR